MKIGGYVHRKTKSIPSAKSHLVALFAANFNFKKTLAEGMFRVARMPVHTKSGWLVYERVEVPVRDKEGNMLMKKRKQQVTEPVLAEKEPCEIFKGATFGGKLVPQEPFVRMLILKPLFEKALLAKYTKKDVKITDVYIETGGDAMEAVFSMCIRWKNVYDGYNKASRKLLMPDLTKKRVGEILAFFRFEGNRIYIADANETRHCKEILDFVGDRNHFFGGNGKKMKVAALALDDAGSN